MATARTRSATRKTSRAAKPRTTKSAAQKARKPARKAAPKAAAKARKPARKTAPKTAAAKARKPVRTTKTAAKVAAKARTPARKVAPKVAAKARTPVRKAVPAPKPPARNLVNWFEVPVRDIERARTFYERVLQVSLSMHDMGTFKMAWFPGGPEGLGATGALMQSENYTPSHAGSLVYFSVSDINGALERVRAQGGRVLNPKMSIGEFGFVGHFEDCEGNRVALHSPT